MHALQCLHHIVENNLTELEADRFIDLINSIVSSVSGSSFAMPMRSKTLRRVFLAKTNIFFPIQYFKVELLPEYFKRQEKSREPIIEPMNKAHININYLKVVMACNY